MIVELSKITDEIIERIKNKFSSKGLDSSGKASQSLNGITTDKNIIIIGLSYIYFLWKGRQPGKQPPPENMLSYVENKPIVNTELKPRSIAYLIGRKIGREGTEIYKNPSKGLQLEEEIEFGIEEINKVVTEKNNEIVIKAFNKNVG